jgi:hypothetical protein
MDTNFCDKMLGARIILSYLPLVEYFNSYFQLLMDWFVQDWGREALIRYYVWSDIVGGLAGGLIHIKYRNFRIVSTLIFYVGIGVADLIFRQFDPARFCWVYRVPKKNFSIGSFSKHFGKPKTLEDVLLYHVTF